MKFSFSNNAIKSIGKIDVKMAGRIIKGIIELPNKGDIKALEGDYVKCLRLRVGDWRVIYKVEDNIVMIIEILPRGNAYK